MAWLAQKQVPTSSAHKPHACQAVQTSLCQMVSACFRWTDPFPNTVVVRNLRRFLCCRKRGGSEHKSLCLLQTLFVSICCGVLIFVVLGRPNQVNSCDLQHGRTDHWIWARSSNRKTSQAKTQLPIGCGSPY